MTEAQDQQVDEVLEVIYDQAKIGDYHTEDGVRLAKSYATIYELKQKDEAEANRFQIEKERMALENLDRKIKMLETENQRKINPNSVLSAAAGLLGILVILGYEQSHVLSTKALGFVPRSRS